MKKKERKDIPDIYDKRKCPFHLNYFTSCLIEDHLITVYDKDIFLFNQLFDDVMEDNDFELIKRCFRYTRDYCNRNKNNIYNLYKFFKAAFYENLRKMEGYDERMEKWCDEVNEILKQKS